MDEELNREFLNEPIFDRNCLSELVKIRKTLEDIEYILEYAHVPQYYVEKIRDENGKTISRNRVYHEAPLEHLRKALNRSRQLSKSHTSLNEGHRE